MGKARTLSSLVSTNALLSDGQISASEIVGQVETLRIGSISYPGDDLAADPNGGQTITVVGAGFAATPTVYVGGTIASSVTFVSTTQITFTAPVKTAGTYDVYVVNPSGATAIRVMGMSYSGTPTWTTAAGSLGSVDGTFSVQLQATSNSAVTYSLASGSTLPSGITLSSGGLLSGTTNVEQTFSFTAVAIDAENQDTSRSFQVTVSIADPYWKFVTLALNGETATTPFNADLSTNKFNLSIIGDTKPNSFSPYTTGYYSNSFTATGQYLSVPYSSALNLTGDFTIECWINPTNLPTSTGSAAQSYARIFSFGTYNAANSIGLEINSNDSGNIRKLVCWYNGSSNSLSTNNAVTAGSWQHIALVRSGTTITLYVNGSSTGTITSASAAVNTNQSLYIASLQSFEADASAAFNGFISNFRVVKGTAVYTANFTPSTTALTAITNTVLLTCQANRFIDSSAAPITITTAGSPQIVAYDPFLLPSNLQTLGSAHFDGSSDYLLVQPTSNLEFGSGDFTIEFWWYPTSTTRQGLYHGSFGTDWSIGIDYSGDGSQKIGIWASSNGSSWNLLNADPGGNGIGTTTIRQNAWNHIAYTRSGTTWMLFVNGNRDLNLTGISGSIVDRSGSTKAIGSWWSTGSMSQAIGYISNFRAVKGTALYTATFTPPTTALTAVTNTQLLTLQTNQGANNNGFLDSSSNTFPIQRVGNVAQGTFSPYGSTWSNYFNGSSDYISAPQAAGALGTNDFTIEMWYRSTGGHGTYARAVSKGITLPATEGAWGLGIYRGANEFYWSSYYNNAFNDIQTGINLNDGVWHHIAATRVGTTLKLYSDGVLRATGTIPSAINFGSTADPLMVGYQTRDSHYVNGNISNLRILIGTALYTGTTYTVPTSPLTAITNTVLLTCQSNRFRDNSTNSYSITTSGSPSVQRFSPFNATSSYSTEIYSGSTYFDGDNDYLLTPVQPQFSLGTGAFTIEAWAYLTANNTYNPIVRLGIGASGSAPHYTAWGLALTNLNVQLYRYDGTETQYTSSSTTANINAWNHVVAVRDSSSNFAMFLNGARVYSGTVGLNYNAVNNDALYIARTTSGGGTPNYTTGYISDVRVTKGSAIYSPTSTTLTVPTAPLTSNANTVLLLNGANSGIVDYSMMHNLETFGSAQTSTAQSKFGSGSLYFNASTGDTDYMRTLPGDRFHFAGDFTIEFWMYPLTISTSFSTNGYSPIIDNDASAGASTTDWFVFHQQDQTMYFATQGGNTSMQTGNVITSANQWYHIALTRSGSSMRIFVNGVQAATLTYNGTIGAVNRRTFIANQPGNSRWFKGYLDDFRVTRGYARYTANFTPPTTTFKLK